MARIMMPTSAILVPTVTNRLLYRVANWPANAENRMNGTANTNPTNGAQLSAVALPSTMKITINLKALSLNAP